jgi:hypothetical protein
LHARETQAGSLWEFPAAVIRLAGLNVPVGGGGYFRLYPCGLSLKWLSRINRLDDQPFVFYTHPWEVDPEQPRLKLGSRVSRFRHYVNLRSTEAKLDRLAAAFRFGRISDVIHEASRVTITSCNT